MTRKSLWASWSLGELRKNRHYLRLINCLDSGLSWPFAALSGGVSIVDVDARIIWPRSADHHCQFPGNFVDSASGASCLRCVNASAKSCVKGDEQMRNRVG